jgi:hypothetical protein
MNPKQWDAMHSAFDELHLLEKLLDPGESLNAHYRGELSVMLLDRLNTVEAGIEALEADLKNLKGTVTKEPEDA